MGPLGGRPESAKERFARLQVQYNKTYNAPTSPGNGPLTSSTGPEATQLPPERDPAIPEHLDKVGRSIPEAAKDALFNAPGSVFKMAKGIYDLGVGGLTLPQTIYHKYQGVPNITNPETGEQKPNEVLQARVDKLNFVVNNPGKVAGSVAQYYKDYYSNFTDSFAEDPFAFISDLTALASVGVGAVGTAGKAAKVAGAANAATKLGKVATTMGKANKYIQMADPLEWAIKGVKGVAHKYGIDTMMGIGKHSDGLLDIAKVTRAAGEIDEASDLMATLGKPLTQEEADLYARRIFLGDEPSRLATDSNPQIKAYVDQVIPQEEAYHVINNILSPEKALRAKAIGAVEFLKHQAKRSGDLEAVIPTIDDALLKIQSGEWSPSFGSLFATDDFKRSLLERVHDTTPEGKFWARLEKRVGGGNYSFDPKVFIPRMLQSFNRLKQKKNFLDGALQYMITKAPEDIKLVDAHNTTAKANLEAQGFRELPKAMYEKYLDDTQKAHAVLIQTSKRGATAAEDFKAAQDAFASHMSKKGEFAPQKKTIFVPEHVANFIALEIGVPSAARRIYRRGLGAMKTAQTLLNPRFYFANMFGNSAILGAYGGLPSDLMKLKKLTHLMPDQLRNLIDNTASYGQGRFSRLVDNLGQFAASIDNQFKGTVYLDQIKKNVMPVAEQFFDKMPKLEEALKYFGSAPRELLELNLQVGRQYMKAAGQIPALRKLYAMKRLMASQMAKGTLETAPGIKGSLKGLESKVTSGAGFKKMLVTDTMPSAGPMLTNANKLGDKMGTADVFADRAINTYAQQNQNYIAGLKVIRDELNASLVASADLKNQWGSQRRILLDQVADLQGKLVAAAKADPRAQYLVAQNAFITIKMLIQNAEAAIKHDIVQGMALGRIDPQLAKAAQMSQSMIDHSSELFGAMEALHPFEKNVVRDFLPYYTFTQAMTKLAAKIPYMWPKRMFLIRNLAREYDEIMNDPDVIGSDQLKGFTPVLFMSDGSIVSFKSSAYNPFENLKSTPIGGDGVSIPSTYLPQVSHPMLRFMIDTIYGPQAKLTSIIPGNTATSLSDGSQWRFDGRQWHRERGNIPLAKHLINQVPLLGQIDKLLTRYVQSDQGFSLDPHPMTKAGGKPKAEIGLLEKGLGLVAPSTTVNPREMQTRAILRTKQLIDKMKRDVKFASPERRAEIIRALQRYGIGETSRILDY